MGTVEQKYSPAIPEAFGHADPAVCNSVHAEDRQRFTTI